MRIRARGVDHGGRSRGGLMQPTTVVSPFEDLEKREKNVK